MVAAFANTPFTNVASLLEREVLTVWPLVSMPVNVTVGTRSFSRVALVLISFIMRLSGI